MFVLSVCFICFLLFFALFSFVLLFLCLYLSFWGMGWGDDISIFIVCLFVCLRGFVVFCLFCLFFLFLFLLSVVVVFVAKSIIGESIVQVAIFRRNQTNLAENCQNGFTVINIKAGSLLSKIRIDEQLAGISSRQSGLALPCGVIYLLVEYRSNDVCLLCSGSRNASNKGCGIYCLAYEKVCII